MGWSEPCSSRVLVWSSRTELLTPLLTCYTFRRLLPDWFPFHPWRWWVHCRMVYLPTSYLYANKCQMPLSPFITDLREEIYVQKFSLINFAKHRSTVSRTDMKRPNSLIVSILNPVVRAWETYVRPNWLRIS